MKIDKIKLNNYRNFELYDITFGAETTVLIGKNGTGKTNLISAIKHSLSFIFAKKKESQQYSFVTSSDRNVVSFSARDARFGNIPNGGKDYLYPIIIKAKAVSDGNDLDWEFYKENRTSGLQTSKYESANNIFWNLYNNSNDIPVLAYFSDSYPHVLTNLGKNIKEMLESGNPLPKNTAYYKWDEDKNCTEIWKQNFLMQYMNSMMQSSKDNSDYVNEIIEALKAFSYLEGSSNNESLAVETLTLYTTGLKAQLRIDFNNGLETFFELLPQGYKRILSIVFDIAHRSYFLNGNCDPKGIVLIDEIELHLHPSLTQEILQRLRKTFPRIQFIVSTHSPLVITNFKQNERNVLYKLYRDEDSGEYQNCRMSDLYGLDYNAGLSFMGTLDRNSHIDDLLTAYKYWQEMENSEMIDRVRDKIKEEAGENSEVYRNLI